LPQADQLRLGPAGADMGTEAVVLRPCSGAIVWGGLCPVLWCFAV